jgi:hypothetical protein
MNKRATARWKIVAALGIACAACCAPLLLPLLTSAAVAGAAGAVGAGASDLITGEIVCVGLLTALVAGMALLALRSRARPAIGQNITCACGAVTDGPAASCTTGSKCDRTARESKAAP